MTRPPRFSVVICNYNYAALVGAAISSVLAQDYPPDRLQLIVVDDGSTDDSRAVYPQFSADPRFHLVSQENRGQTAAFAAGVRVADGDYVCLLDSDDIYLPNKQAVQAVPPLATGLRDWVASPWSTGMFRRDALLDRMFACADGAPADLQTAGFWLACQFAHHTSGMVRIRETLSSCRLLPGASASYGSLSVASKLQGELRAPAADPAAAWLNRFYLQELSLLEQYLPAAWHARFKQWLTAQRSDGPAFGPGRPV